MQKFDSDNTWIKTDCSRYWRFICGPFDPEIDKKRRAIVDKQKSNTPVGEFLDTISLFDGFF